MSNQNPNTSPDAASNTARLQYYVEKALAVQADVNSKVDQNWLFAGRSWTKAYIAEAGELLNMMDDWIWWKKIEMDERKREQACLELADLISFGLSQNMSGYAQPFEEETTKQALIKYTAWDDTHVHLEDMNASDAVEFSVSCILDEEMDRTFPIRPIVRAAECLGFSMDELFGMYVSKAILNNFRQANGYKSGRYKKIWTIEEDGRVISGEDNVFLAHIVRRVAQKYKDPFSDEYHKSVWEFLGYYYMLAT